MNQYTDYSPDLSSLNELPQADNLSRTDAAQRRRAEGRRVRGQNRDKQPKPAPAATKPKEIKIPTWRKIYESLTGTTSRVLFGIFLACLAVYLLVAFISYFSTCVSDQSIVNSMPVGYAAQVRNAGGEGGARLSEFLINESFGLGSLVIVVWLFAMSLKMLIGKPRFKSVNFTIKCFIALITMSLIVGLVTIGANSPVNWGGYHGRYVNEFIVGFVGWTGATLLSLFMLSMFVMICLSDVIKWIMRLRREQKERRRIAAQERAEREAREAEILRMRQQEQIDDLRAGETAIINPESVADIKDDDSQVDFSAKDAPLYAINEPVDTVTSSAEMESREDISSTAEQSVAIAEETGHNAGHEMNPDSDIENIKPEDGANDSGMNESPEDNTEENESKDNLAPMRVNVNTIGEAEERKLHTQVDIFEETNYKFPPVDLLLPGKERIDVNPEEQLQNQNKIRDTLLNFGIPIISIEATVGPTVTLYEIVPEQGVKIAKIRNLVDDIALSLAAKGVRIIAPIPGKGTVGIEVANKFPQTVSMRTIIKSKKYQESRYRLPIALGSTISNEVYIADLAKMPHLLVAGATGQGKSVGLNSIIASLLYCKAPWQLKFVMIDPKQVEFSLYNKLRNYYMAMIPDEAEDPDSEPVLTDMTKVEATLNSLVIEMENRYTLLKAAQSRNIEEYNAKIKQGKLNPNEGHKFLPYIVVVVDEFGDLIMVLGKSVEMPIARLAQKARAVGMHVIIATQRPSVNVITGIIKANFPARISFKVTSGVDSKTILDAPGAEQLIGMGDMLIFNNSEMVRVQGAFIDTPEVEALCAYVEKQPYPMGPYVLPEPMGVGDGAGSSGGEVAVRDRDPLFEEVARMVVSKNNASTSNIQRLFSLGYNRAGRIMDQLENAGIVGPSLGGKPRAVLVDQISLESILSSL